MTDKIEAFFNEKLDRYFRVGIYCVFRCFTWFGWSGHQEYLLVFDALRQSEKVSIDGMLNMAAVYSFIVFCFPAIFLSCIVFITGKQINYLPKIFWKFYGVTKSCQLCWFVINTDYSLMAVEARNIFNLSDDYIPLNDMSNGTYFYNLKDESVVFLELGESLISFHNGKPEWKWTDFNSFITWYFERY
ncbi:hypothetical protein [Aliivibrio fischeri]|uniref:hypothetical protein n=1 Tax=Aliivibrio fischeri TaxID=668 RepID=UPI003F75DB0F